MKNTIGVIIVIIVIGVIVAAAGYLMLSKKGESMPGVSEQGEEQGQEQEGAPSGGISQIKKVYQGFKASQKGDWAEWKIVKGIKEAPTMKYVYAGEDMINGKNCYGLEFSGEFQGTKIAQQVWLSREDNSPVKYVAKAPQGVFCLSPSMYKPQGGTSPQSGTPDEYKPENIAKLNYKIGTFTTETGKTVNVIKVINSDTNQVWVSSQVPFGMVKVVGGDTETDLRDFGSGAPVEITSSERDNCQQLPSGFFQ